jgi:hypothetical protein
MRPFFFLDAQFLKTCFFALKGLSVLGFHGKNWALNFANFQIFIPRWGILQKWKKRHFLIPKNLGFSNFKVSFSVFRKVNKLEN